MGKKKKDEKSKKKSTAVVETAPTPENVTPIDRHRAHLDRVGLLSAVVNDKQATKKARKAAQAELDKLRAEGQARIDAADAARGEEEQEYTDAEKAEISAMVERMAAIEPEPAPTALSDEDAEIRARVLKKRAARESGVRDPGSPEHLAQMQADVAAGREERTEKARREELGKMKVAEVRKRADELDLPTTGVTKGDLIDAIIEKEARSRGKYVEPTDRELDALLAKPEPPSAEDIPSIPGPSEEAQGPATEERIAEVNAKFSAVSGATAESIEVIADAFRAAAEKGFAQPGDVPKSWDEDTNGLGQYKVMRPSDNKIIGYTRMTTYISGLENEKKITEWKMRTVAIGAMKAELEAAQGLRESPLAALSELEHRRDVKIAKAQKADRKGKLERGELGAIVEAAEKEFKNAADVIVDELFELGGGRTKANKGTFLHSLTEIYDEQGMDPIRAMLDAGEILPADLADVEAYAAATSALGLKVVAQEMVVVNDAIKVAGRLDRIYLAKLPEIRHPKTKELIKPADVRAKRYVGDVKTGNVELGKGKIAQQIRGYTEGVGYDPETHERKSHGANKDFGILVHLPAGKAECTITIVDLRVGVEGNGLIAKVRAYRNTSKKAFDTTVDLVQIAAAPTNVGTSD